MTHAIDVSLSRSKLHEQVADRIEQMIVDAALRPGDKLPGERELAIQLNVSRTVIREAMRTLSVRGLVEVKHGSGSFVREVSAESAASSISLFMKLSQMSDSFRDLREVRRTLEVEIAGLAAQRATDADIAAMEAAILGTATHAADAEQFVKYDLDFHSALTVATHNNLYAVLLSPVTDLLVDFRLTAYQYNAKEAIEGSLMHHRRILARVKAHDAEGAQQAMRDHLDQAESLFQAAHSQDGV